MTTFQRIGAQMIKPESAHIEEVRDIRKLDIDFRKGTFAISGPNGSGKSSIMDRSRAARMSFASWKPGFAI